MLDYSGNASLNKNITFFEYNNILWTGIKSINKMSKYDGLVYDLNIEDNHNYVTEMGIVHNSGKRNGNFAIYLEPSHPDIETFIDLKNSTKPDFRLRINRIFAANDDIDEND